MRSIFLLLVAFIGSNPCIQAQQNDPVSDFNLDWGDEYSNPGKYEYFGHMGNPGEGFVLVSHKKHQEVLIQRFSMPGLEITNKTEIDMTEFGNQAVIDLIEEINGNYYIFYSTWDKANEKEKLFAREVNIKNGQLEGDPQKLLKVDKVRGRKANAGGMFSIATINKYNFAFNADSSKMLVQYNLHMEDREKQDKLGFHVFNGNLEKQWSKEVELPYKSRMMGSTPLMRGNLYDTHIDNKGRAYIVARVYEGERKEVINGSPNYHYELMKVTSESDQVHQTEVALDERFITHIKVKNTPSGNIIAAGFYTKNVSENIALATDVNGAYSVKIDQEGNIMQQDYHEFPSDIIQKYEDDEVEQVENLSLQNLTVYDGGSVVLTGEQRRHLSRTRVSGGTATTYENNVFQDVYVLKISNGELSWLKKIPKKQRGKANPGTMSYRYFHNDHSHYLFYIDNADNTSLSEDQEPAVHLDGVGGYFTVVEIDQKGQKTKSKMFDVDEKGIEVHPSKFNQVSPTTLIKGVDISAMFKDHKLMRIEYTE